MKVFYIDLKDIDNKRELHEKIADALALPEYYGSNLDALADVLAEYGRGWDIIFYNTSRIREVMPAYMDSMEDMCRELCEDEDGVPGNALRIRFYP